MRLPDDFDIDSLPVIGEGAAQTPQAQIAQSATGQSRQQQSADFDLDSLPELPRIPTAEEKAAQFDEWKRRRDAAQAAVPEERRPGERGVLGDVARGMFTAEGIREAADDSLTAKPYAYMNDLANSIVSGFLGGGAKISEAAGRIIGDNAVGRAIVNDAQAGQAKLERALPTNALDTSGGGVVNRVLDVGKGVAHVTGEFAPAAIPGIGQAYAATTVSAGSVNRYGQVKKAAKASGYSDSQAEAWATGAGALDALQNILLMRGFRGIWGGGQKAAADAAKQSLVKKLMVDTVKTGAIGSGGGMAQDVVNQNVGIDQNGQVGEVRPYDWTRTAKVGVDQFFEFGAFHLVNTAAHAMPKALAWESAPRTMSARLSREALDTPEGRALVMCNNPEAAKKILEARKSGKDVSRRMLEELGIPSEVAPSKGDRNALADSVADDYRAWKDWQKTLPDKQQSAALDAEIAGVGAEGDAAAAIRQRVLEEVNRPRPPEKDGGEPRPAEGPDALNDPKRRAELVMNAAREIVGDNGDIGKQIEAGRQADARAENEAAREAKRTAKAEEAADAARAERERLQAEAEQEAAIKERAEQEARPNAAVEEMKAAEAEARKQEANPHQARLDAWPEYAEFLAKNHMKNTAKNWNKFVARNDLDPTMKVETSDQAKKRGAKEFERGLAPDEELAAFDEYSKYVQGEEYQSGRSNLSFDEWLAQRREGAKNGPTIAPREEGTTTPPNGAEPPQGGKSAENGTVWRSVSADTIGGEPQTTPEPPATPASEPKKPFGTGDSSHGTGKYSRKNYDSDSANTGATGAATWHWQNGERVYSLPVDLSQTRPGGPVVLDKTDSAYERINELLNGRQLVMTKSGKIQFKGEFKGAVPKELRELLGRELKIGKNPDAPSKDDLYGVNKGQFGEETRTTWEEVERAVAADRENYHNWQKHQQRADRRASEEKKLEKKVKSGKATQNDLDILRHRNLMEDYLDQGGKETDADYKAMERDLEVLQESGTYDYEGLSKEKDAADKFSDAEWENAIGDIESGEGDFSPSGEYVKPFTRENLQGAKKGDIIHFDHDEVKYELDRYDHETGVMEVYRSDENGVKRRFKVSRNGVEEIRNDGKGQKGVVQDNAGDAGGGGRPAPGAAGGEARGAEGAAGRGTGTGGAEARKPASLTTEGATPEQRATWTDRGGTTHVLEGFAAPSSDNVAKGAHVAVRHDNGVLYQGEIVGIGPKNVKVKTDGGMYGGETVLTFPRKDIVGVRGRTGETRAEGEQDLFNRREGSPSAQGENPLKPSAKKKPLEGKNARFGWENGREVEIDPSGTRTEKNPLGQIVAPEDGSVAQSIDAEIAADEARAAKGKGKPLGAPPAPAPGSPGNATLNPHYEPESLGAGIKNPVARKEIVDEFKSLFGDTVAIRGKNTTPIGKNFAGHYEPDAGIVRTKNPVSLDTIPHEVGHHIEELTKRLGLARPPNVRAELIALGKKLYNNPKQKPAGGYEAEGFAELMKYYMQGNDAGLKKDAPEAYKWLTEEFGKADPDTMAKVDAIRDMVDRLQNQTGEQAVRAMREKDPSIGERVVNGVAEVVKGMRLSQESWLDEGAFITKAMKKSGLDKIFDWQGALKRGDVAAMNDIIENHPVLKWKLYNGTSAARAFTASEKGLTDLSGSRRLTYGDLGIQTKGHKANELLPTVKEIFADFTPAERDEFKTYAIARVAKELYLDKGLPFGVTKSEVNDYLSKHGNNKKFADALELYTHYKHGVLHLLVDSGAMSQQQFEAIVAENPIYVKISRVRESSAADAFRNKILQRRGKAVNRRKGGSGKVQDIFDAGLLDDERVFAAAFQADLLRSLINAGKRGERAGGVGAGFYTGANWLREVPNAQGEVKFTSEKLRKQVTDAMLSSGVAANKADAKSIFDQIFDDGKDTLSIFKEKPSNGKNGLVSIYDESGKLHTYELPENNAEGWARGLMGFTEATRPNVLEKWIHMAASTTRSGATILNPYFMLGNLVNDSLHAATVNEFGVMIPGISTAHGLYADLMGTKPAEIYDAMGLPMGTMLGAAKLPSAKKANKYLFSKNWFTRQWNKGITKAVADFIGVSENANRIEEFEKARNFLLSHGATDKAANMIAGCNALDITLDFKRGGYTAKAINRLIPFFNAGIQGIAQISRKLGIAKPKEWQFEQNRGKVAARTVLQGIGWITSMAIAAELWNRSSDERKRKADELPAHEKWNYISFGDVRIPHAREMGYIFGSIPKAVFAQMYDGQEGAVAECLGMLRKSLPGMSPRDIAGVGPLLDVAMNEYWHGQTIVPEYIQKSRQSYDWYDGRTTEFSKMLGKAMYKVFGHGKISSPAHLEAFFNGVTGNMYGNMLGMFGGEQKFDTERPHTWPMLRKFFRDPTLSRVVNDFYDRREELTRMKGSGEASKAELKELEGANKIAKDFTDLRKKADRIRADKTLTVTGRNDRLEKITKAMQERVRKFDAYWKERRKK